MIPRGVEAICQIPMNAEAPQLVLSLPLINDRLSSLTFTIYTPHEGLAERLARSSGESISETVEEHLRNDDEKNEEWQILASDLNEICLDNKIISLHRTRALAINSKCALRDDAFGQIPMMDFKPSPGDESLLQIENFLQKANCEGVILESGASYHFFGFDILEQAEWVRFMGQCLLAPHSDTRWIGHSLVSGTAALRITKNQIKPIVPFARCIVLRSGSMFDSRSSNLQTSR